MTDTQEAVAAIWEPSEDPRCLFEGHDWDEGYTHYERHRCIRCGLIEYRYDY